ncbi:hypothetical protein NQZ68_023854 [Dissostichus eleginoides]|nr:hypothetical protein NQZ68_023854 [Dissostichus eleginoides]
MQLQTTHIIEACFHHQLRSSTHHAVRCTCVVNKLSCRLRGTGPLRRIKRQQPCTRRRIDAAFTSSLTHTGAACWTSSTPLCLINVNSYVIYLKSFKWREENCDSVLGRSALWCVIDSSGES